ncbi:probable G-protein coupled receptor B0563.6 [Ceratina calcarata]|uniref:Probable G-protein coupled receptor B0563.6 n=1 Tax=Ceratina calcarata TaxID=156304 RepID=A0AAJ7S8G4_9HYME|nr:probable G-protein coupled receptor B0563.6 [Ceratina calcarata]
MWNDSTESGRESRREKERRGTKMNATEPLICLLPEDVEVLEDPRITMLRRISYGIVLPTICCLGIVGNVLNLIVLTRRNMRGTAYIYMRGNVLSRLQRILIKLNGSTQVYKIVLEVVFKVAPTILLAGFNLRIMIVYRRSCERRRRMTLARTVSNDEDTRTFAEERRLVLLLGSTSILFLLCVSPMVILNITLRESNLSHYPYQVFRAVANLLEVINYSITFYIYCLFSEDFRNTLIRTLQWPWGANGHGGRGFPMKRSPVARPTTTTTTPPTTATATPGHFARASV